MSLKPNGLRLKPSILMFIAPWCRLLRWCCQHEYARHLEKQRIGLIQLLEKDFGLFLLLDIFQTTEQEGYSHGVDPPGLGKIEGNKWLAHPLGKLLQERLRL